MRLFWKKIGAAGLVVVSVILIAAATDHWILSLPCPPCHSDRTRSLPRYSKSSAGLVTIAADGMVFRARVAGLQNSGDGVIFLHGYPETSIMWGPALKLLVKNGFRVVAFDQRGYSPDARPGSVDAYALEKLSQDVISIADVVGFKRFHLVGHDWGAMVGWTAAQMFRDRIVSFTSLSMPHPDALLEALGHGDQLLRSSYILFNWIPWISEFVLSFNNAAYFRHNSWRKMDKAELAEYVSVFSEPGAMRGVLNWYRANTPLTLKSLGKIKQPVLFLWGNKDESLGRIGAEKTADYIKGPYRFVRLTAGHQLMAEMPEKISNHILKHILSWPATDFSLSANSPEESNSTDNPRCADSKPACLGDYIV